MDNLWQLALASMRGPQEATPRVLAQRLAPSLLWQVLLLCAILSTVLTVASALLMPGPDPMSLMFQSYPLVLAGFQFLSSVVMVFGLYHIGRAFGGAGSFDDCLQIVAWLQVILLGVSVAQFLVFPLFPLFSVLISFASVALFFYLFTGFVQGVHGFASAGGTFVMIVLSMIAILMVLAVLLSMLGLMPMQMMEM